MFSKIDKMKEVVEYIVLYISFIIFFVSSADLKRKYHYKINKLLKKLVIDDQKLLFFQHLLY